MDIVINGVTLKADFMDADFVEPYENATIKMQAKAQEMQTEENSSYADAIRTQCKLVDEYFDDIFGDGTSAKVFADSKSNLMTHLKAVESLTNWAYGEKKKLNDFTNKYTQRQQNAERIQKFQNGKKKK